MDSIPCKTTRMLDEVDIKTFATIVLYNHFHNPSIAFVEFAEAYLKSPDIRPISHIWLFQHLRGCATDEQLDTIMGYLRQLLDSFLDPGHQDYYFFEKAVVEEPMFSTLNSEIRPGARLTEERRDFLKQVAFALATCWALNSRRGRYLRRVYRSALDSRHGFPFLQELWRAVCGQANDMDVALIEQLHFSAYAQYRRDHWNEEIRHY